jgi:hypothetical protein
LLKIEAKRFRLVAPDAVRAVVEGRSTMDTFRSQIIPLLLTLHGLLVLLGALSALKDPARAASLYLPAQVDGTSEPPLAAGAGPALALFMAPLQLLVVLLMLRTAYTLLHEPDEPLSRAAFMVGALSLLELGFAAMRLRINALRGNSPPWRFPPGKGVISATGTLLSLTFSLVYAVGAYGLWVG